MMAAPSFSGGASSEPAGPHRAEAAGELLRRLVAGPREGIDLAILRFRHLRHDMGGGAEAVNAEPR
jgi:hypothetical protein